MRLATIRVNGTTRAVRADREVLIDLGAADLGELLSHQAWAQEAAMATASNAAAYPAAGVSFAPVVPRPSKIVCVGLNYRSHIQEMGRDLPQYPTLFAKFADTLAGAHDDIIRPQETAQLDWEAELAVVIGRPARRARGADAEAAIAGFTVLNDITCRDWQFRTREWLQGKIWDASTPVGPYLVTPDELPGGLSPRLPITLTVDGELMQYDSTGDLLFGPVELVGRPLGCAWQAKALQTCQRTRRTRGSRWCAVTPDLTSPTAVFEAPETIRRMLVTTWAFLYSLDGAQRRECEFAMDDPGRLDWDFIPKPDRRGIPLSRLGAHQRTLVHSLLAAGLSEQGYTQALQIMALENILRERETPRLGVVAGDFRNSDQYFVAFFGRPGFEDTWGWRFLGHHLSLSYTIVEQRYLSVTPLNMGAQPASAGILAPLAIEEGHGFALLASLTDEQRSQAVIHTVAPADYATRQVPFIGKVEYPDFIDLGIPWYGSTRPTGRH